MEEKIFRVQMEDGVGLVVMDVPGQSMNTWTREANQQFSNLLDELEKEKNLKGVIFLSGKSGNFHSGGDLNLLGSFKDSDEITRILDETHRNFNRLQNARFPSVAAIHGHCLGGGYEFALACTARIAQEGKTTLIGLPECQLGLFPGGGGTQRLTRLIGLPAIEFILGGKVLSADKALELGLVDRLVPQDEDLLQDAKEFLTAILDGQDLRRGVHDFSGLDAAAATARERALKATRGRELPGQRLALKAIQDGVGLSLEDGLKIEQKYFVEVLLSKEAKGSINTFFLQKETNNPKSMLPQNFSGKPIKKVGILGFGTMGRGIAIDILRQMRVPIIVKDSPEMLEKGKAFVRKILQGLVDKRKLAVPVDDLLDLLVTVSDYGEHFRDVDLVIEAVFEDKTVKETAFRELSQVVSEECIIVSNTSTIPVTEMARSVKNPQKFAGMHFFSPVWMMELVEVIRGKQTNQDTVYQLLHFVGAIRKRPIVCNDNPGFVVNAMFLSYFTQVYDLLAQGISIEEIESAMVKFGFPVGPVKLIDEIGIDVHYNAFKALGIQPPGLVEKVIADGRYGLKKNGRGFFQADGTVDPAVVSMIEITNKPVTMSAEEIQKLMFKGIVKKGRELLDLGIVENERIIDAAAIWGAGFPADKGGPLKWADLTGTSQELYGKLFYPA